MFNKISLVTLPKQDLLRPPGALAILAAACEDFNVDYRINDFNLWLYRNTAHDIWQKINDNWDAVDPFDANTDDYYKIFLQQLDSYIQHSGVLDSDLIAISVFSDVSACCAVEFIKRLNADPAKSKFKIVIGGTGIRARLSIFQGADLCQGLLDDELIDYFIFGEGEITFRQLIQGTINYPGINNYNTIQIEDLNQFPVPSYEKINPWDYEYIAKPEIVITGSRGCVRKCTYCDVAKYWPKYRYRSGQKIADELYHYYKTLGITDFEFSDSLINGSLKMFREMNLAIIAYQKKDPNFKISYKGQYICRPADSFKEQDYINMKQAGGDYLYVGVESFSDKVRHDMLKKFNNSDLDFHLKMCGKYGIKNSFLMLVGYPTETLDDHQKNLQMLKRYQHYAQAGVIAMIVFGYTANILEDTPLYHLMDELHIDYDKDNYNTMEWISLDNPTLTINERIRRWVELTVTASDLGYSMPRMQHYIMKFISVLEQKKDKFKKFSIKQI